MGRLTPEQRSLVSNLRRQGIAINVIVVAFSCSRQTIWYWSIQDLRSRFTILRNYESKITVDVEITILFLRSLGYGCARIKQRLFCAPEIELSKTEIYVQGLIISRTTINNVLKKHKLNGYFKKRNQKAWKFFRAKYADELWQIDLKEFKFDGKKYYFLVCIDDYSRYLLALKLFEHCPTTKELAVELEKLKIKPKKILADNGGQFRKQWKSWCKKQNIEAVFAHPYYLQDKGKVERTNRNIAEELVNIIKLFRKMLTGNEIASWVKWFNEKRFNNGIKDFPANLYVKN